MYFELNVLQTDIDIVVHCKLMPCPSTVPRHFWVIQFFFVPDQKLIYIVLVAKCLCQTK